MTYRFMLLDKELEEKIYEMIHEQQGKQEYKKYLAERKRRNLEQ